MFNGASPYVTVKFYNVSHDMAYGLAVTAVSGPYDFPSWTVG